MAKVTEKLNLFSGHEQYNARWLLNKKRLTVYTCGHCNKQIITPRPERSDVDQDKPYWDSATTCVHCGKMSFVAVWANGKTLAKAMPGRS